MFWVAIAAGIVGAVVGAAAMIVVSCIVCGCDSDDDASAKRVICETELRWLPPSEANN